MKRIDPNTTQLRVGTRAERRVWGPRRNVLNQMYRSKPNSVTRENDRVISEKNDFDQSLGSTFCPFRVALLSNEVSTVGKQKG